MHMDHFEYNDSYEPPQYEFKMASRFHRNARDVYEISGYNNFDPMVVLVFGEKIIPVVMTGVDERVSPSQALRDFNDAALEKIRENVVGEDIPLSFAVFHGDVYYTSQKSIEEAERLGPLAEKFKNGDSDVAEALSTIYIGRDQSFNIQQPYKYTPVDGWEWSSSITVSHVTDTRWLFENIFPGE